MRVFCFPQILLYYGVVVVVVEVVVVVPVPVPVVVVEEGVTTVAVVVGAATTVKFTVLLVIPSRDAVILVVPTARHEANPVAETVATVGSELVQVTCEERSTPEKPSELVPEATNVWATPTGKLDGEPGAMVIEVKVAVDVGFDVQAAAPSVITAINPRVRPNPRKRR